LRVEQDGDWIDLDENWDDGDFNSGLKDLIEGLNDTVWYEDCDTRVMIHYVDCVYSDPELEDRVDRTLGLMDIKRYWNWPGGKRPLKIGGRLSHLDEISAHLEVVDNDD
jgi:hypothetical protein